MANRNHCPKFKFYSDGKGNLDNFTDFTWKLNKKELIIVFEKKEVEKEYSLKQKTLLSFEKFDRNEKRKLKVKDTQKNVYYLWSKVN